MRISSILFEFRLCISHCSWNLIKLMCEIVRKGHNNYCKSAWKYSMRPFNELRKLFGLKGWDLTPLFIDEVFMVEWMINKKQILVNFSSIGNDTSLFIGLIWLVINRKSNNFLSEVLTQDCSAISQVCDISSVIWKWKINIINWLWLIIWY